MDDLASLDWSSSTAPSSSRPATTTTSSAAYPALRPTPSPFTSGRNTPLSSQASGAPGFKPPASKPAQDSFSNLVNFSSAKSTANLSLREQQERLEAEKRRKEEDLRRKTHASFGDGQFLDSLGRSSASVSRTASPAIPSSLGTAPVIRNGTRDTSDDDLFAAFKADTQVDNASYYPPRPTQPSASSKPSPAPVPNLNLTDPGAWQNPLVAKSSNNLNDEDDPFGLSQLKSRAREPSAAGVDAEDDDLLGDLGKPIEQVRRTKPAVAAEPGKPIEDSDSESADEQAQQAPAPRDPFDKAVAQLVDYGFTAENARRGLTESGAGLNVQAAANWLLDDAHRQAKEKKAKAKSGQNGAGSQSQPDDRERSSSRRQNEGPTWQTEAVNRSANRSPAVHDGDISRGASAVGSNLLKTANTLWKTSQKKVQKAVAEFQQEGSSDSSQPKWMRSAQSQPQQESTAKDKERRASPANATDEALMLETGGRPEKRQARPQGDARPAGSTFMRTASPASSTSTLAASRGPTPKWQQGTQAPPSDPRSRLTQQAVEERSASAYVSPARRRRPQPQAEAKPPTSQQPMSEPDLLVGGDASSRAQSSLPRRPSPAAPQPRAKSPPRPPRLTRQIPSLTPAALQTCTKHRLDGTAHFKRGDYAAAHASYTSSIAALPQTHPLVILLLTNRALTALKTGEPRQAADDADTAIALIGPGKGEGEGVDLGTDNEKRDMRDLYAKALTRKAEALEQMEKWADAATAWQACVEAGVGGATALAGRQRCQNALVPKPKPKPKPAARAPAALKARPRPSPAASQAKSSEALQRLRAANKAAEREGDEKIALIDRVDARIAAWRDEKRDNLRALLGSMENVLWEGSGWNKVGLHELVMANKVKIVYMKAIGKTHPDKLPQEATTEIRMIAGHVFSTLNEAWDKFKAENGL